jgi:GT2 family glycosyltransferase
VQRDLVSIIIITRNSATTLGECIASIHNQSYANYEIILVDNGSTDETLRLVDSSKVTVLANSQNLGFAKANNQALAIAKGEFICFLNADAAIKPDYLEIVIPHFRRENNLGALAGKILRSPMNTENIIDSAGFIMEHWRLLPRDRGDGELDQGQYDQPGYVFGVPGACAFYRRSALEATALGQEMMDEDFFAYYEDVDLAWRVRQKNWAALYVPEAIAYHHKKGPRGKEIFIQVKAFTNRYWCYLKNERFSSFLSYAMVAIPYEALRVVKTLVLNPSWIPAYFNEWLLLGKMIKKRRALNS